MLTFRGHLDVCNEKAVGGWAACLDRPTERVEVVVSLDGVKVARVETSFDRPDVNKFIGKDGIFGFRAALDIPDLGGRTLEVRFAATGELLDNGSRFFAANSNHIIVGTDGWYFERRHQEIDLAGFLAAHTEWAGPSKKNIADYLMRHRRLSEMAPTFSAVIPDKAAIYRKFLPGGVKISDDRMAPALSKEMPDLLYPAGFFRNLSSVLNLYHKTDSHLTDHGMLSFYSLLAERFVLLSGMKLNPLPEPRKIESTIDGDLSHPSLGNETAPRTVLQYSDENRLLWKNGVTNYGAIRWYRGGVPAGPRILLFGTSSALQLARFMAISASELLFVFNHDVDYGVVRRFAPDAVVLAIAEKILARTIAVDGIKLEGFDPAALKIMADSASVGS